MNAPKMIRPANPKPPAKQTEKASPLPVGLTKLQAARAGLFVWMDAEEGAEYLGVSPGRFREAAASGQFMRYRDLGGYRYHRDDLDEYRRSGGEDDRA